MAQYLDWHFHIYRAGRVDWPSKVERYSPWLQPRRLGHEELWFFWRGKGMIQKDEESIKIEQSDLFWFHPGHKYTVQQDPLHPLGIAYVEFSILDSNDQPVTEFNRKLPNLIKDLDANLGDTILRRLIELYWESYLDHRPLEKPADEWAAIPFFTDEDEITRANPFAPMPISFFGPQQPDWQRLLHPAVHSANGLFHALLIEILHQVRRDHENTISGLEKYHRDTVARAAMQIQENPKSVESITQLASAAGYSTDHFTRTFKKIMNCSPQQFLLNTRITKAKLLLIESELSIKEIADQLGYCNAYFFSRQFKTMTGGTPSGMRAKANATGRPSR